MNLETAGSLIFAQFFLDKINVAEVLLKIQGGLQATGSLQRLAGHQINYTHHSPRNKIDSTRSGLSVVLSRKEGLFNERIFKINQELDDQFELCYVGCSLEEICQKIMQQHSGEAYQWVLGQGWVQWISFTIYQFILSHNPEGEMSKVPKRETSPLKFDTSSANIGCFIRPKSKSKQLEHERPSPTLRSRKKARYQREKQIEFQDKAFLESVVCKVLADSDCQGITQLIDDMDFAGTSAEVDASKESHCDLIEQEEISQFFKNFQPISKTYLPNRLPFDPSPELYRILPPHVSSPAIQKQECRSTIQSSAIDSLMLSPRSQETNPELLGNLGVMPVGYGYGYYQQGSYLYQRQMSSGRKKRNVSGEEVNEYKIIPDKIEADGRTTLMIRHIPNKYSEEMLFEEIGRNHRLKVNFLYLPIDHYNACNVGYAFVNFIHSKFILDFYNEFNGRRWDRFNSQKICELAYARIQGTTNLMDHFQNSTGSQLRGRTDRKLKPELDQAALKTVTKVLDFQKVQDS